MKLGHFTLMLDLAQLPLPVSLITKPDGVHPVFSHWET